MNITSINVQITRSPRQFEAVRLGAEASIDLNENAKEVIQWLTKELNNLFEDMYPDAPKKSPKVQISKELVRFDSPKFKAILGRMEREPEKKQAIYDKACEFFDFDDNAAKTLKLALCVI